MPPSTARGLSQGSALELLPPGVVVEILSSFDSYENLFAFIITSSVYYQLFVASQERILTRIAQKILGPAWGDATALLNYQRKASGRIPPGPSKVQPDFIFLRSDIPQLKLNQTIFKSVAGEFSQFLLNTQLLLGNGTDPRRQPSAPTWYVPVTAPVPIMGTTFFFSSKLPIELFYKLWIINVYFQNDTLTGFSMRVSLTRRELKNLKFISRFILDSKYYREFKSSTHKPMSKKRIVIPDIFWTWTKFLPWLNSREYRTFDNPILRLKMIHHMHIITLTTRPCNTWTRIQESGEISSTMFEFLDDYEWIDVEDLIEKYSLDILEWG